MELTEVIYEQIQTDDEPYEKSSKVLKELWKNASEPEKKVISITLMTICGWTYETLLKMAKEGVKI